MFKKITSLLLIAALAFAFVIPAHSAIRTVKKEAVKTELSTKILKTDIVTINHDIVVSACTETTFNLLTFSELNRPPGNTLVYANYARFKRYNKHDASINIKYNKQRLCNYREPITRLLV